ncbi:hypothetical protein F7734_28105 [Scytonema sp. UIC 10036]|uniref:hypothetical protein n=1 Tax=Scytonema sp. UIC 10036 TaxID=2304196 RepID=UPI0012DA599D|nr:hypothetical protein [Scytonema sp. UIC 10036]MUG96002.1 hypothetical protein [Scytonema sp. UIC 10036]
MFVAVTEIREHLPFIDPFLAKHNLSINRISDWFVHPGEPKVFQYIELEFGLDSLTMVGSANNEPQQ